MLRLWVRNKNTKKWLGLQTLFWRTFWMMSSILRDCEKTRQRWPSFRRLSSSAMRTPILPASSTSRSSDNSNSLVTALCCAAGSSSSCSSSLRQATDQSHQDMPTSSRPSIKRRLSLRTLSQTHTSRPCNNNRKLSLIYLEADGWWQALLDLFVPLRIFSNPWMFL